MSLHPRLPAAFLLLLLWPQSAGAGGDPQRMRLELVDKEPARAQANDQAALSALAARVESEPKDRRARFEHVMALMRAGQLDNAKDAAIRWRESDAYNLVVVRLLGDIYSQLGQMDRAMRTYSAVVELLPEDANAQRALASVLKQSGQLEPALERLQAALDERPEDARLRFEMADVLQRLGKHDEARTLFEQIIAADDTPDLLRYPAKERLAQSYQRQRRNELRSGRAERAQETESKIETLHLEGGNENDIKVFLTWDTDRSDVDLWVTNPAGEKVFYSHKEGQFGGKLFGDVTNGYGPESFTAHRAHSGQYQIAVNYYSEGSSNFPEARGEVVIVLHEGQADEERRVLPYRLFEKGQTVTVANVYVP